MYVNIHIQQATCVYAYIPCKFKSLKFLVWKFVCIDESSIFLRTFQALHKKNDILLAISTSGNSKNIVKVLKEARKKKIKTIGFLGSGGGIAKNFCDIKILVPSYNTARIQECHIFLGHFILQQVENKLFKK